MSDVPVPHHQKFNKYMNPHVDIDMSNVLEIDCGYKPRQFQAHLHNSLKRFNVLVCHRRFGKTVFSIMEMIDKSFYNNRKNPQYAYVAPTYGQAKRVAWEYFKDFTKHFPGVKVHEQELRIDIPRPDKGDKIRFMLLGAENPDSLAGIYLDGVVLDEYSLMNPVVWSTLLRPALSDRKGWAIFIGTPRGQNHFHDIYNLAMGLPNWYTAIYKASETNVVDAEELIEAAAIMSEEEYEQEYECSFTAALVGAYYGKYINKLEDDGRIREVPHDSAVGVDTYWDLGIGDTTAIWFVQRVGKEAHIIDYHEANGLGLEAYVKMLKQKPYVYDTHYLPHDAAAREIGTGRTRQETLREFGLKTTIVPRQSVDDGINAVRLAFSHCYFDKVKTKDGVNALKNYQRKWDGKLKMFINKPLHDWSSHGSDAFRMFGLMFNPDRMNKRRDLEQYRSAINTHNALG